MPTTLAPIPGNNCHVRIGRVEGSAGARAGAGIAEVAPRSRCPKPPQHHTKSQHASGCPSLYRSGSWAPGEGRQQGLCSHSQSGAAAAESAPPSLAQPGLHATAEPAAQEGLGWRSQPERVLHRGPVLQDRERLWAERGAPLPFPVPRRCGCQLRADLKRLSLGSGPTTRFPSVFQRLQCASAHTHTHPDPHSPQE